MKNLLFLVLFSLICSITSEGDLYQQVKEILQISDQTQLTCNELSDKIMILENALDYISSIDISETERILTYLPKLEVLINELKQQRANVKENQFVDSFKQDEISAQRDLKLEEIEYEQSKQDKKIQGLSDNAIQSFDSLIQQMEESFKSVKTSQDKWLESQGVEPAKTDDIIEFSQKRAQIKKQNQTGVNNNYEAIQNEDTVNDPSSFSNNSIDSQISDYKSKKMGKTEDQYSHASSENTENYYLNEQGNQTNEVSYQTSAYGDNYDEYSHFSNGEESQEYQYEQNSEENQNQTEISHQTNQYYANPDDYSHFSNEQQQKYEQYQEPPIINKQNGEELQKNQSIEVGHYSNWQDNNTDQYSHVNSESIDIYDNENQDKSAIKTKNSGNYQNNDEVYNDNQFQQNFTIEKSEASIRTKNSPKKMIPKTQEHEFNETYNYENNNESEISSQKVDYYEDNNQYSVENKEIIHDQDSHHSSNQLANNTTPQNQNNIPQTSHNIQQQNSQNQSNLQQDQKQKKKIFKYFEGTHADPEKKTDTATNIILNNQQKLTQISENKSKAHKKQKKNRIVVTVIDVKSNIPQENKSNKNQQSPKVQNLLNKHKKNYLKKQNKSPYSTTDPFISELDEKFLELQEFMQNKKELYKLQTEILDMEKKLQNQKFQECEVVVQ